MAANDQMAIGAIGELLARGVSIPQQIAVVGFDDDDQSASTQPPLTTVRQPVEQIGQRAVELLFDRLHGRSTPECVLVDTEPVLRRSCGCTRSKRGIATSADPSKPRVLPTLERLRADCRERTVRLFGEEASSTDRGSEALLDGLAQALAGTEVDLDPFAQAVMKTGTDGGDPLRWQDILQLVEAELDSQESSDPELVERGRWFLGQANLVVTETAARTRAAELGYSVQRNLALQMLGSALMSAEDENSFTRILTAALPALGIRFCCVCLFEDTLPERSGARVIVAFDSSRLPPSDPLPGVGEWWWGHEGRVTGDPAECLTSESQATVVFSTEDLLPPGLKMDDVPTFLSVHPLTYAHRPLGYAVFDQPWRYGRVWTPNAIANHLSNAVYVLQQAEHLRSARRTAEEASAAKSEFVARMSHEIRTPLTAIMGYLDLCLGRITAPNERRYLMQAQASSKVLLGVLNDVLDFSKIEAQRLEIERTRFDLDQVLDQIVATCAANAFCKNVELVLDVAPGIPAGLVGDPLRLTQVLMNLVGNAIKFTARGEVVLSIELVPEAGDTTRLRFTVRDTGIGISPENLAKLTVPFVQADNSTTRRYGGTGLGLAISERLIQRMGGMLRLQSEVGRGMECSFCLQFSTDAEASRSLEEYSWPDRRVLVVDDNLASLKVITRILSEAGARVRTATTGEGAIGLMQQARQGNDPVQLLLLDEGLPGRTGCDLAQRLVDLDLLGDCRILVMAPLGELELSPMVAPEMISGIVSKPVRRGELQDRIHSVFAESEGESPPPPQPLRESDLRNVLAGRRFLLVQDDEVNRMLAKELLENAGVEVDAVESGIEAVEQVASVHYDAVLMDLDLPIMDGCEATRKIRQSTAGSILPIIAVTASVSPEDRDHCLEAGMDDYLQTPIDSDHLLGVLASWVCGPRTEPPKATGVPSVGPGPAGSLLADGTGPTHDLGSDWLDVRGSLRRLGGDRALYRRLLHRFLENHSTTGQHLQKGRRTETALRTVHTLGSAAANIGASELQKAAQALEVELRAGKPGDAAQWAKLESTLGQTLELIAIVGRNSTVPPPSSNILDPERLRRHLTALAELLDRFDAAASDFVDLLPALAGTGVVNEEVRRIQRAVRAYDFEGAGQRVQTLLSTLGQPRA